MGECVAALHAPRDANVELIWPALRVGMRCAVEPQHDGPPAELLGNPRVFAQEMMEATEVVDVLPPDSGAGRPINVLVEPAHSQRRDRDERLPVVVVLAVVQSARKDLRQPRQRLCHIASRGLQDVLDVTAGRLTADLRPHPRRGKEVTLVTGVDRDLRDFVRPPTQRLGSIRATWFREIFPVRGTVPPIQSNTRPAVEGIVCGERQRSLPPFVGKRGAHHFPKNKLA